MSPALSSRRGRLGALTAAVAAGLLLLSGPGASASPAAELPDATTFYKDPDSQVSRWTAANPNDSRQPVIKQVIADRPQGIWFSRYNPSTVTADVRKVTSAAASAGQVPVLVAYALPNRDCGGASAGGAPDIAAYNTWIDNFAAGLGDAPVVVVLEPDSLALITCLNDQALNQRYGALSRAAATMHAANPKARVYFDAGHSAWNSASVQAGRLRSAGAVANGDGIFTNVSNFRTTSSEVGFAKSVLSALGDPDLRAVVDTSRNGNGPTPDGQWCDPQGRAVGEAPTAATGDPQIDAYLWVKPPGESDGCVAAAGTFSPDVAYALATN